MLGFARYLDHERFNVMVVTDEAERPVAAESGRLYSIVRFRATSIFRKAVFKAGESRLVHLFKVLWNVSLNRMGSVVYRTWVKAGLDTLEKIHKGQPVDLIISSYAPAHVHVAAASFVKAHPEVIWIADMRDEMSLNPHLSRSERDQLAGVENSVNDHATAVTSVSRPILDDFRRLLPKVRFFEEVRNGFDHDLGFGSGFNHVFRICYTGTFYGINKPSTFFKAFLRFLEKNPVPYELQFVGSSRNFEIPVPLRPHCRFLPKLDYYEAIKVMSCADANLLVIPKSERKGVYSGKLFDYLSVGKPIIAVVDSNDVAAGLIRDLNAGFVADFDDEEAIVRAVESAYALWKTQTCLPIDAERIRLLHRRVEVGKLNELITELTGR
ncbi:MAG: hypothetical protein RL021_1291 [Bacteroidota bacterium]